MDGIYKTRMKTRAEVIKEQLEIMEKERVMREAMKHPIELYPVDPYPNGEYFFEATTRDKRLAKSKENVLHFREEVLNELVFQTIYGVMLEPVLEASCANDHQKDLAAATAHDFVVENGAFELLNQWKYKNYYLAEMAQNIEAYFNFFLETAKDKIKEGLSEKDAYEIENKKIKDYVMDTKDLIPPDISKTVLNRVEDAINDFTNDNKLNKDKIMAIYNKAQDQVAATDGADMTPEDMQQVQQEAVRLAKKRELAITEASTNVFGAMVKIMTESIMSAPNLQEAYSKENGRLDFPKILGDVKSIYTFMECMNTYGVINADSKYLSKTLKSMKEASESSVNNILSSSGMGDIATQSTITQDEKFVNNGDSIQPKEKIDKKDLEIDNNPSNDFISDNN